MDLDTVCIVSQNIDDRFIYGFSPVKLLVISRGRFPKCTVDLILLDSLLALVARNAEENYIQQLNHSFVEKY